MDSTVSSALKWFQEKFRRRELVTFPDFVKTFGYSCEKDAHDAFMNFLSTTEIPQRVRTALSKQYAVWERNSSKEYWASKELSSRISVSSKRTAVYLLNESERIIKKAFIQESDQDSASISILDADFETGTELSDDTYLDSNPSSARSSFNPIEMGCMNHLVGPGTTSSSLGTSKRLVVGGVDVSRELMTERKTVVQSQSEIDNVSDLLSLNFIFDDEFLRKCLPADVYTAVMSVPVLDPSKEEFRVLTVCSVYATRHSFLDTKKFIRTEFPADTLTVEMLQALTSRSYLWQDSPSEVPSLLPLRKNEDTYLDCIVKPIIYSVLADLDINDHWTRDPLPTPQGFEETYIPDYYGEKSSLPFVVVEVKKPEISDDCLESDKRKLSCMMKIMLDRLLSNGVKDPVVIGILVGASRCNVLIMELEYEALYLCKKVGSFELPRNNFQLGLLLPALGPLHFIQDLAKKMIAAIDNRTRNEKTTVQRMRRPSYYVRGIRIPVELSKLRK